MPIPEELILPPDRLPELGPGVPNSALRHAIALFDRRTVPNPALAAAAHSALWVVHDFLDESHEISQALETPTGSLLHAIMHRREPDAWNSKYWWRRVGTHPIFAPLAASALALGYLDAGQRWNPERFVDDVEAERGSGSERESLLCRVQRAEFEHLLAFCFQT